MVVTQYPEKVTSYNYDQQALPVPGSEEPGYSAIYRNTLNPEIKTAETIYDVFHVGREKAANKPCLGHREWDSSVGDYKKEFTWITYAEVEELRTAVGSGLCKLVKDKKLGDAVGLTDWTVGIWCQNRPGECERAARQSAGRSLFPTCRIPGD